jgi:hypothetical protein
MSKKNKVILFGILNWGMGHATRSSVLIEKLQKNGDRVVVLAEGNAARYIKLRFPEIDVRSYPFFEMRYSPGVWLLPRVGFQLFPFIKSLKKEKKIAELLVKELEPDLIISDNRYGFYHPSIPSYLLCHQLHLSPPLLKNTINNRYRKWLGNFNEIWVPDYPGSGNLSGNLSRSIYQTPPLKYIGPLTALQKPAQEFDKDIDVLGVISGPEPGRKKFEIEMRKLFSKLQRDQGLRTHLILGKSFSGIGPERENPNEEDFAGPEKLSQLAAGARLIISRSGYSSIMDYHMLESNCLMIPTAGQPEQEYLANYHYSHGNIHLMQENEMNLSVVVKALETPRKIIVENNKGISLFEA